MNEGPSCNETTANSQPLPISSSSSLTTTPTDSQNTLASSSDISVYIPLPEQSTEYVYLNFARVCKTHKFCFICKSTYNIQDVPFEARMQVFTARKIFIPKRNRCCSIHLINKRFYENEVSKINIFSKECSIEVSEVTKFLDKLSKKADSGLHEQIGNCVISEERIKALTGQTYENILEIENMMISMRSSKNRSVIQALILFFI